MRVIPLILMICATTIDLDRSFAAAQMLSPNSVAIEQVLVLKNGEIFRGHVTRKGQKVVLQMDRGSTLYFTEDETDFICNSMVEAYWGKCARVRASDLAGQKSIFYWCLRHQLWDLAQSQIDVLMEIGLRLNEIKILQEQLRSARSRQLAAAENSGKPRGKVAGPIKPAITRPLQPIDIDDSLGNDRLASAQIDTSVFRPLPMLTNGDLGDSKAGSINTAQNLETNNQPQSDGWTQSQIESVIRQVNFEQAVDDTAVLKHSQAKGGGAEPAAPVPAISKPELDQLTRSMPRESFGNFRRRVERNLAVGCNAANCHTKNSAVMPLTVLSRTRHTPSRISQLNLHSVLQYVDRENPLASPILKAATTAHGGSDTAAFQNDSIQYRNLKDWLVMISDDPSGFYVEPENLAAKADQKSGSGVKPVESTDLASGFSPIDELPTTIGEIPKLEPSTPKFTPRDPFDPEIFNLLHKMRSKK